MSFISTLPNVKNSLFNVISATRLGKRKKKLYLTNRNVNKWPSSPKNVLIVI